MFLLSWLLGSRKDAVEKKTPRRTKLPAVFEGLEDRALFTATTPPLSPSGLVTSVSSSTAIKLNWKDNSDRETGYKIERSTDDKNFTQLNEVGSNATNYTSGGLTKGKKYYFRVRAYSSGGNSKYTNVASATPEATSSSSSTPGTPEAVTVTKSTTSTGAPSWANGGVGAYATGKWFFDGTNISFNDPSQVSKAIPVLKSLHVGTVRMWWGMTTWNNRSGNWAVQEAEQLHSAGFKVIMTFEAPQVPSASQITSFFTYVKNKPGALKSIDFFEIGNEPNQTAFWKGSASQYVNDLLKPAYQVLHAAGATVLGAGPTWDVNYVKTLVANGYLNYCDYAGFHPYGPSPQDVLTRAAGAKAAYQGKPVIFTEWNVRGSEGNPTQWAKEVDQARKLIAPIAYIACYFPFTLGSTEAGKGGLVTASYGARNPFYDMFKNWGE